MQQHVRVNALNGLLLISSVLRIDVTGNYGIVSMPSTGFYLFLLVKVPSVKTREEVSMPSTGFYLFLQVCKMIGLSVLSMCQCPQRASTYFFRSKESRFNSKTCCVNALNGLLLISSGFSKAIFRIPDLCQCPQRASTYFFYPSLIR